jgi:RNA polymerase sigma-70 factor (ECF subfamily)
MLSPDELAAAVVRAQGGDTPAFEVLARAFSRAVYAVALAHVRRPADAEDVAQDALFAALVRIDDCREPARFGAWLLRIARNHAMNHLKRRKLRDVREDDEGPIEGPKQELRLVRRELLLALEALAPAQREVVLLHDLDGWSHAEIAAALDITEEASRQQLVRARRALRAKLE